MNPFWLVTRSTYKFWPLRVACNLFDAVVPLFTIGLVNGCATSYLAQYILKCGVRRVRLSREFDVRNAARREG